MKRYLRCQGNPKVTWGFFSRQGQAADLNKMEGEKKNPFCFIYIQ
ncbi:hypothetical protein RCO48_30260 [Peribacillus frigoritolerans]|nr:hypothetical protein [Peribacillus frigoritolerans]